MSLTPEQEARETIDKMLDQSGWDVQDVDRANIHAKKGVAIREFPLNTGHGFADYLLYVDGKAAGVIEAKKVGNTLTSVEIQSDKYKTGLPEDLPAWYRPLPFCYQSTGIETRFTNDLDPVPRSRGTFSFHLPETLEEWLRDDTPVAQNKAAEKQPPYGKPSTLNLRLKQMPELIEDGLWPAQIIAVKNLEKSLAQNRPRALIQMATGGSLPYKSPLKFENIKELADTINKPPHHWTEDNLWAAYAALEKSKGQSKVRGASGARIMTDLVSLVRYALDQENELVPFPEKVDANFKAWLAQQEKKFDEEKLHWLEMIKDHIAGNLSIDTEDFEYSPFVQEGGLGKFFQLFGEEVSTLLEELNEQLAA